MSAFFKRGKKTAWDTWSAYEEFTDALLCIRESEDDIPDEAWPVIERFTILMYDRTSTDTDINTFRRKLFCKKGRSMEDIPPTKDALIQHTRRAVYQGKYVWSQLLELDPYFPSPLDWGWKDPPELATCVDDTSTSLPVGT